jgi:hypothetical protein
MTTATATPQRSKRQVTAMTAAELATYVVEKGKTLVVVVDDPERKTVPSLPFAGHLIHSGSGAGGRY